MKIITYNINGIRAAISKGFVEWVAEENPDILCLQEVKAEQDQLNIGQFEKMGYQIFWNSAVKKGYSGVATFTKVTPEHTLFKIGDDFFDKEGRFIQHHFQDFTLINAYFPSGSSGEERQKAKYQWLGLIHRYMREFLQKEKKIMICGDVNICHKPIDIHNPTRNKNTSGFLPEERQWISDFLSLGFVDAFRHFNDQPNQYTWWSYRAGARAKNLGWRIDYFFVQENLVSELKKCEVLSEIKHSDHCPVLLQAF